MTVKIRDEFMDVLEAEERVDFQTTNAISEMLQNKIDFGTERLGFTCRISKRGEETCATGWKDFMDFTSGIYIIEPNAICSVILPRPWPSNALLEYQPLKITTKTELPHTHPDIEVEVSGIPRPKRSRMVTLKIERRSRVGFGPAQLEFYSEV